MSFPVVLLGVVWVRGEEELAYLLTNVTLQRGQWRAWEDHWVSSTQAVTLHPPSWWLLTGLPLSIQTAPRKVKPVIKAQRDQNLPLGNFYSERCKSGSGWVDWELRKGVSWFVPLKFEKREREVTKWQALNITVILLYFLTVGMVSFYPPVMCGVKNNMPNYVTCS